MALVAAERARLEWRRGENEFRVLIFFWLFFSSFRAFM